MSAVAPQAAGIANAGEARDAAERLAERWKIAGPERDRDRRLPLAELEALAESGLLAISVPEAFGGPGLSPSVVAEVFATLASADVALAQIGQNHFDFVDVLRFAEEPFRSELFAAVLGGARFGNALAERGVKDMRALSTRLIAAGDGFLLSGTKHFATGALTAAWIPVMALDPSGQIRVAYVERHAEGVEVLEDWDAFGQRATFSGTAIFTDVYVPAERVVERGRGDPSLAIGLIAGNQLIHAAIEYGGARGSLAALLAAEHTPTRALTDALEAARIAVARAARLVDSAVARTPSQERASVHAFIAVDAAKVIAYRVGPLLARNVFAARDPRSVIASVGLDRHWRNSRVHSLHDPARLRERELGAYLLTAEPPGMIAGLFEER